MKYMLQVLLLCCFLNSHAQKDKTLTWVLPQHKDTSLVVNTKSIPYNNYFYAEYVIVPALAKKLQINILATVASTTNKLFNNTFAPFILQVFTRKETLLEKAYQDGNAVINIQLKNTDTIALFFISNPPVNDATDFKFDYTIGDTAELNYANKNPQEVFEKMLESVSIGFINTLTRADYPNGLFAKGAAEMDFKANTFAGGVTQFTGEKLNRETADKNTAEWNKKIAAWLKDYNVTKVEKFTNGDVALNTDVERTFYTKRNAEGKKIFKVTVFKEPPTKEGGTEPIGYTTGVRISK